MRSKLLLPVIAALFLLSFVLTGCQSGGVAQDTYDKLKSQYNEIEDKYQQAASEIENKLETPDLSEELEEALAENADLQAQIDDLIDKYVLEGATPAETAEKIVKYYHETHVYDKYDLFVCSDMASEVWNMLKAQGINARMVVGDIDNPISDIILSKHAWVQAEIAPGEFLALETTGGRAVYIEENPLYYQGWYFTTPADHKNYQSSVKEYNTRVEIVNDIIIEINKAQIERDSAVNMFNTMVENQFADIQLNDQEEIINQWGAIKDKLVDIRESMEAELNDIKAQIDNLATRCGS